MAQAGLPAERSEVGNKWLKKVNNGGVNSEKRYLDKLEYTGSTLEAIYFAGGRVVPEGAGYAYQYIIRDHPACAGQVLGNSRVMFKDTVGGPKIVQENHYYPFGMNMDGVFIGSNHKYQYTGKELHDDLGYNQYDYGARWYDPSVGRFTGVDPLASDMPTWSPYTGMYNNPIRFTDPTGMAPESPIFGRRGEFLGVDSEGYSGDIIVMDADKYNMLTKNGETTLDHSQVMKWAEFSPHAANLGDIDLSAEAVSNILTHVTLQTEGVNFDRLEGGIINTIDTQNDDEGLSQINGDRFGNPTNPPINATAMEVTKPNGSINVTTRMLFGRSPMSTVEHVQSTLGIHEYKGHGLLNIGGGADEKRAYMLEYNNKSTFNKLSLREQNLIKKNAGIK